MGQYTADQVINMMDESGSEADLSELESEESEIEEDPSFPLPHSDSDTDSDESEDESPGRSPSVMPQSPLPVRRGQERCTQVDTQKKYTMILSILFT